MISKIAVVIPIYKQFSNLNSAEKISLVQCYKVLNTYDIFFVTHEGIDTKEYQNTSIKSSTLHFNRNYFNDLKSYSQLLMTMDFYKSFSNYDFILITQLDVFVFSDMLERFCKLNYDYIGAPWFEGFNMATENSPIIGVGNGGFSLRKCL